MTAYTDELIDAVTGSESLDGSTWVVTQPEGFKTLDVVDPVRSQLTTLTQALSLSPSLSAVIGLVLIERIRVSQSDIPNHKFHFTMSETAAFVDQLSRAIPLALTETVTVTPVQVVQRAIRVIEALQIADVIAPAILYHFTLSDQLIIADVIAKFLGADALDALTVTDTMAAVAGKGGQIDETITIAETITPMFMLRVIAEETLEIADANVVQMLFNGELTEAIEIAGMYLGPSGSVTTWAMNTRSAGVTEYQNYAFNSFARLGNKYLGATQDGLYELLGDNDDGTSIIATIRSGFAQWAGTHLGSFKAAYLAVRGDGNFVLKVLTADGKTYVYQVMAQSMKTVKVNMGKGLRARYFAFELISSGQDFDLDTLEFIPLVAGRRV